MNERIVQLALQAGLTGHFAANTDLATPIPLSFEAQKFAELIVSECAQYIEDKFDFCGDEIIIAEKLREHFGIKE